MRPSQTTRSLISIGVPALVPTALRFAAIASPSSFHVGARFLQWPHHLHPQFQHRGKLGAGGALTGP